MKRAGLLTLLAGLAATAAAADPSISEPGWSRPVGLAATSVEARPGLVVDDRDRAQLFFIDREAGRGLVRWMTAGLDGRILAGPRTLGEADLRARALAAEADGSDIRVVWVAPSGDEMRVLSRRISGSDIGPAQTLSATVEDAGPVSLAHAAGAHAAWSQASGGRRTIWYQGPRVAPSEVDRGDAPGLAVGPSGPWIAWWQRVGFDTYRLVAASLRDGGLSAGARLSPQPLTGNLATSRLQPPAVAHDAAGVLHVVFGTELRGFGPAVGRLTLVELGAGAPSHIPVASRSPFAAAATATPWQGTVAFAWTDLRSGRSRNAEIYVGLRIPTGLKEHRLTYTLTASALPVLASGPGPALTAAWLELASGGGRFTLHLASTARPAMRWFLMDIPELDVYRPGETAAFALTALVGTFPYSLLITLATALLTGVAAATARALLGDTPIWVWLGASGSRSAVAIVALALAVQTAVTAVLPLVPRLPLPVGGGVLAIVWVWLRLRRRVPETTLQQAALAMVVSFGTSVVLVFSQVARTLSQLGAYK